MESTVTTANSEKNLGGGEKEHVMEINDVFIVSMPTLWILFLATF
jgi:hypothetical protein